MKAKIFLDSSDITVFDEIIEKSKLKSIAYEEEYYNKYYKDIQNGIFKYIPTDGRIFYEIELNHYLRENDIISCMFGCVCKVVYSYYDIDTDSIEITVSEV